MTLSSTPGVFIDLLLLPDNLLFLLLAYYSLSLLALFQACSIDFFLNFWWSSCFFTTNLECSLHFLTIPSIYFSLFFYAFSTWFPIILVLFSAHLTKSSSNCFILFYFYYSRSSLYFIIKIILSLIRCYYYQTLFILLTAFYNYLTWVGINLMKK